MRTKQYLAAIRPVEGRLMLSTMVYADEINDPLEIPELADLEDVELPERELAMAAQLIESLSAEFEGDKFHDTYREAVLALIEQKASGEEIIAPVAEEEPAKVVDLMAALEASVAAAKQARSRHPTAHDVEDEDETETGDGRASRPRKSAPRKAAKKTAKKSAKKTVAKKTVAKAKSA
jgi:DNA end-binding protein Ku